MGRAARNPSQRAQTMGFAQLNPSYWNTGWDTGTSSFQTAECDLDLHGRNHRPLPTLPIDGGGLQGEQRQKANANGVRTIRH
jgi:hypothetical protein